MFISLDIKTNRRNEFINITNRIYEKIKNSGIINGLCILHVPHTTAGLTINENADADVVLDILSKMVKLIPQNDNFLHIEGNSDAHIKSSLFGPTLSLIIENGDIVLGTWQAVYFCEFDGPRNRRVFLKIIKT